ncbi:MAG: ABC transporter permease, partial [Candidatus Ranarchaeia archaeon]
MTSTKYVARQLRSQVRGNILVVITVGIPVFLSTIISYMLSEFNIEIGADEIPAFNISLINNFRQLLFFLWFFSFLLGLFAILAVVFTFAQNHQRDVALAKSVGAGKDFVYGVFMATLLILILSGISLGAAAGILIGSITVVTIANQDIRLFLTFLSTLAMYLFLAYVSGYRPITRIFNKTTVGTLSFPSIRIKPFTGLTKWLAKRNPLNNFALKNLFRMRSYSRPTLAILFLIFFFASISTYGYFISTETSSNYLERGYGEDVIVVAHPVLISVIEDLYSMNTLTLTYQVNFSDSSYIIDQTFISELSGKSWVLNVSPRSLIAAMVKERPRIEIYENQYFVIGQRRNTTTLVVGCNPASDLRSLFYRGGTVSGLSDNYAIIGDTLAFQLFDDPLAQYIEIDGKTINVTGFQIDPFARGRAVYLPMPTFQSITNYSFYNAIWLQLEHENYGDAVSTLESLCKTQNLSILELNSLKEDAVRQYSSIYRPLSIMPFLIVFMAFAVLTSYMITTLRRSLRDYLLAWQIGVSIHRLPSMLR